MPDRTRELIRVDLRRKPAVEIVSNFLNRISECNCPINLALEYDYQTFIMNTTLKDDKLHFTFMHRARDHYPIFKHEHDVDLRRIHKGTEDKTCESVCEFFRQIFLESYLK
jgi:hypothetical protein